MPPCDLLCLANSRKLGGHCVAGLRLDGSGWVRPTGTLPDGILLAANYTLDDGTEATPLDVIRVGLRVHQPAPHQPENWVIDGSRWTLRARPASANLADLLRRALVRGPDLLGSVTDRATYADFLKQAASASLALVAPDAMHVYHQSFHGKKRVRGQFSLGAGEQAALYDLSITEPHWEELVICQGPRTLRQVNGKFIVTISLGEPFVGESYKLITAIIPLPPSLAGVVAAEAGGG
jgi:hypothetical protein